MHLPSSSQSSGERSQVIVFSLEENMGTMRTSAETLRFQGPMVISRCQAPPPTASDIYSDNINWFSKVSSSQQWRSLSENKPAQSRLTRQSSSSMSPSSNAPGSCSPDGVDPQFLEDYHKMLKGGSIEDASQYYCDKVSTWWPSLVGRQISCDKEKMSCHKPPQREGM